MTSNPDLAMRTGHQQTTLECNSENWFDGATNINVKRSELAAQKG